MLDGNYFVTLSWYIEEGLKKMSQCNSEYKRLAATRVLDSPDCQTYRAAIAAHKERIANSS